MLGTKMFDTLKEHKVIGWDIDETLINGVNSNLFQSFVVNHPEHEHHLITFRNSKEDIESINDDLLSWDKVFGRHLFTSLQTVPLEIVQRYNALPKYFQNIHWEDNEAKVDRVLAAHKLEREYVENVVDAMLGWKARACLNVNATVLVDDIYSMQKPYCDKHNVAIIDSLARTKNSGDQS